MNEKQKSNIQKQDLFVKLTVAQLIVCLLLGAVFFAAFRKDRDFFDELSSAFYLLTKEKFDFYEKLPFIKNNTDKTTPTMAATTSGTGMPGVGGEDMDAVENSDILSLEVYQTEAVAVYPVSGATVSSKFGERVHPIYGTDGFHSGIDLAADEGSPVYAALDGMVTDVGVGEMSGNYVKIKHATGIETLYCHLQKANIEKNTVVRKGDVIGFVGQTGLATGPHLHFEVLIDGVKHNPSYLLDDAVLLQ